MIGNNYKGITSDFLSMINRRSAYKGAYQEFKRITKIIAYYLYIRSSWRHKDCYNYFEDQLGGYHCRYSKMMAGACDSPKYICSLYKNY